MRIPLDYYRILSVPIKATPEQLEQAYSDRLQQQPRREYGETAIVARQKLIENGYLVLSSLEQRAEYDARFFSNFARTNLGETIVEDSEAVAEEANESPTQEQTFLAPSIDIAPEQFVGVLLILQELGEYEQVLKLGSDYLNSAEYAHFVKHSDPEIQISLKRDIILSLALAYLELGREQWHRQEYENAAVSDRLGIDLLTQENLFPGVKEEIEIDLYKLRPYRILELIVHNPVNSSPRAKGFQLLQEMLAQRQGIEGKGEDSSGLTFDRFLCFIQQLRTYLTSAEQEQLFVKEAQTASPIANYLAVYALVARGFALKQPQSILRAQQMLEFLSQRQDVYWEESVCALLLGHTQKAIKKLQKSQDIDNIEIIKNYYQNSDDMLPGLCFYGEKWLQEEVISQFCDLVKIQITLKEYFADREVQKYLEELSPPRTKTSETAVNAPKKESTPVAKNQTTGLLAGWKHKFFSKSQSTPKALPSEQKLVSASVSHHAATATLERNGNTQATPANSRSIPTKAKASGTQLPPIGNYIPPARRHHQTPAHPHLKGGQERVAKRKGVVRKKQKSKETLVKGWLFLFTLVMGVGTAGFVTMKLLLNRSSIFARPEAQLAIAVSTPPVVLPPVKSKTAPVKPKLTFKDKAEKVIEKWLDSKAAAFGKEHQIDKLNDILVADLLTTWRDRAVIYQQENTYREYEHQIKMRSATIDKQNPQKAIVEAEVKEVAKHYQGGQLNSANSYDDNLLVRYELILQGDKWLIKNAEVLKTL